MVLLLESLKNDWQLLLEKEFKQDYYRKLQNFLREEYREYKVYPPKEDVYNALRLTAYQGTKAVIIGQDPYHGEGQAHGLSFSVRPGIKKPPSLQNIYKELQEDLGIPIPDHGYLKSWAEEGVLLLNTVLTVRKGEPYSHKNKGWERFTNHVISLLNQRKAPVVFILWGRHAQEKKKLVTNSWHYVLESPHPSPFSARKGFFGSRVFSRTNELLIKEGIDPIDWSLPKEVEES
ncbi:uracil-DNA glycosylase [Isachenkonia alkalipeptolytica]|uniref:Uracil-DNA glycosylase n=1 Tax=Isachenkonia alkalipeptolytica TaxID=2565777 RepID=A0AA43XN67_9CLOT|nr:uracil-DNA glycosylase [Isachenkonia alkalipeptolytica]NBG89304.1 uracil-DNA glycosylase [Isachenkonia alkalipeptolytica]